MEPLARAECLLMFVCADHRLQSRALCITAVIVVEDAARIVFITAPRV